MSSDKKTFHYDTLSQAVNDLQKRGYTTDFLIMEEKDCIFCQSNSLELSADEFVIDEIHRFEEMSDPDEESIVYAISSTVHGVKGMIINSFGANFGYRSSKLVEELHRRSRQQ